MAGEDITTLSIGVSARLDQFRRDMAQLPGIGAQEAKDLAAGIRKSLKEAENASKAVTAAAKRGAKEVSAEAKALVYDFQAVNKALDGSSLQNPFAGLLDHAGDAKHALSGFGPEVNKVASALANVGSSIGGPFARIASLANGAVRPLAEVSGSLGSAGTAVVGLGVGAAGSALAVAALAAGALSLASGAAEAADRLTALNAGVSADARADLGVYAEGTAALGVALDRVRVTLGSGVAAEIGVLAKQIASAISPTKDFGAALADDVRTLVAFNTLGASEVFGEIYTWATKDTRALLEMQAAMDKTAAATQASWDATLPTLYTALGLQEKEADEAERSGAIQQGLADKRDQAAKTAIAAAKAAAAAEKTAAREATAEWKSFEDQLVKDIKTKQDWVKVTNEAHAAEQAGLQGFAASQAALRQTGEDADVASMAIQAMFAKGAADARTFKAHMDTLLEGPLGDALAFQATITAATNTVLGDLQTLGDARIRSLREQADAEISAANEVSDTWAENERDRIARLKETGQISDQQAAAALAGIDDELTRRTNANNRLGRDEREAALKTFRVSQNLARIQAILSAAAATAALTKELSYLQFGAPFAAAGIAGAMLTTQLLVINQQTPPEFPMGRAPSPDHGVPALLQDDEAVTSRRGTELLGRETIARANAGQTSPTHVTVTLGRRVLAEAVGDTAAAKPADPRAGRADPRYRGVR